MAHVFIQKLLGHLYNIDAKAKIGNIGQDDSGNSLDEDVGQPAALTLRENREKISDALREASSHANLRL